jgi:hypothetical protein
VFAVASAGAVADLAALVAAWSVATADQLCVG